MEFVTFHAGLETHLGVLSGNFIVDLNRAQPQVPPDLRTALAVGYCWRIAGGLIYVASRAKRDVRVFSRGWPVSHAVARSTFMATAVATCCRLVLANPR
jgi:hypothetical protein